MNLPNRLTLLRMVLVPFMVLFLLCDAIPLSYLWALLVFVAASLTDFLDGKIARSRDLVTNFGKFLDPMADKVLVLSAMICLIPDLCSPVVVIIVAAREFMVSSLRLVAAAQGIVLAAGWSGKAKTASQMVSIVVVLLMCSITQITGLELPTVLVSQILMWITAALAVYSGLEYLVKNWKLVNPKQ